MDFSYCNFDLDMKTLKFPPVNTFLLQGIETCAASYLLSAAYKLQIQYGLVLDLFHYSIIPRLDDIVMLATAQHKYYHCKKIGCIAINNT